jgi:hypothetical protein
MRSGDETAAHDSDADVIRRHELPPPCWHYPVDRFGHRAEWADLPTVPDAASPRQVTEPRADRRGSVTMPGWAVPRERGGLWCQRPGEHFLGGRNFTAPASTATCWAILGTRPRLWVTNISAKPCRRRLSGSRTMTALTVPE